jgi:hypothetical protein
LAERPGRRRVEKFEAGGVGDAPESQVEHQRGEVSRKNFGPRMRLERRGLRRIPQSHAEPGLHAAGAAPTLIGTRARHADGFEPGQTGFGFEARYAGQAAVHHDPDPLDGQRGLGDGGGEHDFALSGRRRRDRTVLRRKIKGSRQAHDGNPRIKPALRKDCLDAADLGHARQKRQHGPGLGCHRGHDGIGDLRLNRQAGIAPHIAGLNRERLALTGDEGRVGHQRAQPRRLQGRRHRHHPEVLAQARLHVERQRQAEIGIKRALMKLIEQNGGDMLEAGIVQDHAGEDTRGHDFDAGAGGHLRAHPHPQPHGRAELFAKRGRKASGRGPRGQPARFKHDQLTVGGPGLCGEDQRHPRCLAGPGRGHQDRRLPVSQCGHKLGEHRIDGQRRSELHGINWLRPGDPGCGAP